MDPVAPLVRRSQTCVAMLMGRHERLGAASTPLGRLMPHLVRRVVDFLHPRRSDMRCLFVKGEDGGYVRPRHLEDLRFMFGDARAPRPVPVPDSGLDEEGFLPGTAAFTVEAWFTFSRTSGQAHRNPILSKHGTAAGWELRVSNLYQVEFVVTPTPWTSVTSDGGAQRGHLGTKALPRGQAALGNTVQANTQHHVAATWDGDSVARVFLDGELIGQLQCDVGEVELSTFSKRPLAVCGNLEWQDRCLQGDVFSFAVTPRAALDPSAFVLL